MNMLLKVLNVTVVTICMFLPTTALAVPASHSAVLSDKQALQQKLMALSSYRADFVQQVYDESDNLIQQLTGAIAMQQPNQLFWQTEEEDGMTIIADGKTIWQLDSFSEQVIAFNQESSAATNPFMLIAVPEGPHWQQYEIEARDNGYLVKAIAENSVLTSLLLRFDQSELTAVEFFDNQNQRSNIVFSNIQQGVSISPDTFHFVLPAGFEFDDQR